MLSLISWTDLCVWVLWKRHRWKMRISPRTSVWTLLRSSSLTYLQFFLFFTWSMRSSSWTLWWGMVFVLLFNFWSSWQGNVTYRLQISRRSLDDLILGHECQIGTLQISFWILPSQQKRAFSMSHRTVWRDPLCKGHGSGWCCRFLSSDEWKRHESVLHNEGNLFGFHFDTMTVVESLWWHLLFL